MLQNACGMLITTISNPIATTLLWINLRDVSPHVTQTRTSSPVRIDRNKDNFESVSLPGLFPVGEGAGYAGGIVSAAVDGMHAGFALAKQFNPEFQTAPSDFGLRD